MDKSLLKYGTSFVEITKLNRRMVVHLLDIKFFQFNKPCKIHLLRILVRIFRVILIIWSISYITSWKQFMAYNFCVSYIPIYSGMVFRLPLFFHFSFYQFYNKHISMINNPLLTHNSVKVVLFGVKNFPHWKGFISGIYFNGFPYFNFIKIVSKLYSISFMELKIHIGIQKQKINCY